jgi:ABC-type multidrug transport system fused ATPase/permease subunit
MNVVFICVKLGPKFPSLQEPVLFSSTLRFNLDPGGRHTDDQIRRALELAGLPDIAAAPGALDQVHISEALVS